jgi:nicotinamidase-related amidase
VQRLALVVIDMQKGFGDPDYWGPRNNPDCERNVAALLEAWREAGQPVVIVRHDSTEPASPFVPGKPGNELQELVDGDRDLLVTKSVSSAFHGDPDLGEWLRQEGIERVVLCGAQTNMCCETSARVGANLGFDVSFAIDATHTFDLTDAAGATITADELARVTHANLDKEFCRVVTTSEALGLVGG